MKKIYIVLTCLVLIISIFVGCVPEKWAKYHPSSFPDTIWATKDNKVIIEVDGFGGYTSIYINQNNEKIELYSEFRTEPGEFYIETKESIVEEEFQYLECWDPEVYEDKFVVTVVETTYFNVGDVLTFYNVGENTNNDNHISYDDADKIANDAIPQKEYEQDALFSRKETIENKDYFVFYARAQSWNCIGNDDYLHDQVKTYWIYINAVTGEVYEIKATGAKVNVTKEDALKEYNGK